MFKYKISDFKSQSASWTAIASVPRKAAVHFCERINGWFFALKLLLGEKVPGELTRQGKRVVITPIEDLR